MYHLLLMDKTYLKNKKITISGIVCYGKLFLENLSKCQKTKI